MKIYLLLFLAVFVSCSQIQVLDGKGSGIRPEVENRFQSIKKIFREGQKNKAMSLMKSIDESSLTNSEKAMKQNLLGVFSFSLGQFDYSLRYFENAENEAPRRTALMAQIQLNLASAYYKNGKAEQSLKTLEDTFIDGLSAKEFDKFHRLRALVAGQLENHKAAVNSLVALTRTIKNRDDLKSSPYLRL